jgi:hypothetical protein
MVLTVLQWRGLSIEIGLAQFNGISGFFVIVLFFSPCTVRND